MKYFVFTRNWVDPDGVGHGFRVVSWACARNFAQWSADGYNDHPVAGASEWEVGELDLEKLL